MLLIWGRKIQKYCGFYMVNPMNNENLYIRA
jgi:hypothetical protein